MNKLLIVLMVFSISNCYSTFAQPPLVEAEWIDSNNEYAIKQVVSNSRVKSGVNFTYFIFFKFPQSATTVTIMDNIPQELEIMYVDAPILVQGSNSIIPTIIINGNIIEYKIGGNISAFAGNMYGFNIIVRFKEGTTCDGDIATNFVAIGGSSQIGMTPQLTTTAIVHNPWVITKNVKLSTSGDGPTINHMSNSCDFMMIPDTEVEYEICVHKNDSCFGSTGGQANMDNIVISDIIGNAVFISGSSLLGTVDYDQVSQTVTHIVPRLLDASNPTETYCFTYQVRYPSTSFPFGQSIFNIASLTGNICNDAVSLVSDSTCIEIIPNLPTGILKKYLYMTNKVPGCEAYYTFSLDNRTSQTAYADTFRLTDVVPDGLLISSISLRSLHLSSNITYNLFVNSQSFASTQAAYPTTVFTPIPQSTPGVGTEIVVEVSHLPAGEYIYAIVHFTIDASYNTGDTITNCLNFDPMQNVVAADYPREVCRPFVVGHKQPLTCAYKMICNPQNSYQPGDIITFRLRIQNIGSAPTLGGSIGDDLSSNFEYIGNERTYSANLIDPPCGSAGSSLTTPWNLPTQNHYNPHAHKVKYALPVIDSHCNDIARPRCGNSGALIPYYFIEYDVKVKDDAMPGITKNQFIVDEMDGTFVWSNIVDILITANYGMEVEKSVNTDGGTIFTGSGTVLPGNQARYRLALKNTSNVPLTEIKFVDLLGKNDNTNDWAVSNRLLNRGSEFDIDYIGNHSSIMNSNSLTPAYFYSSGSNITLSDFGVTGSTPSSWVSTFNIGDRNIKIDYDTLQVPGQNSILEEFAVEIPMNTTSGLTVCNDFAAIASSYFMIDYAPHIISLLPIASDFVCLTVDTVVSCCDSVQLTLVNDCCARLESNCIVVEMDVSVDNGIFENGTLNGVTLNNAIYGGLSNFSFSPGSTVDFNLCVEATGNTPSVIHYTLFFDDGTTCNKSITTNCSEATSCCDSIKLYWENDCCLKLWSPCPIDEMNVTINKGRYDKGYLNGALISTITNINDSMNLSFSPNGTSVDLQLCLQADSNPLVQIAFELMFSDGTICYLNDSTECSNITAFDNIKKKSSGTLNVLEIYPNPTEKVINIKYASNKTQFVLFELYSTTGQIVLQNNQITNVNEIQTKQINVQKLPKGIYMLSLTFDKERFIKSVVIK